MIISQAEEKKERKYKLLYFPSEILAKPCVAVDTFDSELHLLLDEMKEIMLENKGVGLSANQVGSNKRVFVMLEQKDFNPEVIEFINPVIEKPSKTLLTGQEGCLSMPGVYVPIVRPAEVTVRAFNRNGEMFVAVMTGIEARCAFHEIEHLNGINFLDRTNRQNRRYAFRRINRGKN